MVATRTNTANSFDVKVRPFKKKTSKQLLKERI